MKKSLTCVVFVFIISITYSVTYQQYHHFDRTDTRGLTDTQSYVEMAKGNYDVIAVHKYRFMTPLLVSQICTLLGKDDDEDTIYIVFYLISYTYIVYYII